MIPSLDFINQCTWRKEYPCPVQTLGQWKGVAPIISRLPTPFQLSNNFYNFPHVILTIALCYWSHFVGDVIKAHCCSSTGTRLLKALVFRAEEMREKTLILI